MINNAPMWLLRHQYRPWGARFVKRPPSPPDNHYRGLGFHPFPMTGANTAYMQGTVACSLCGDGVQRLHGKFENGLWYHEDCWKVIYVNNEDEKNHEQFKRAIDGVDKLPQHYLDTSKGTVKIDPVTWTPVGTTRDSWRSRKARKAQYHRERSETDPGNLDNTDYRYFIGHLLPISKLSICRCCESSLYGKEERLAHKDNKRFLIGNANCIQLLNWAYKSLLAKGDCIQCGGHTTGEKWGIPLCSAACVQRWKFQTGRPSRLIMELLQAKNTAVKNYHASMKAMADFGTKMRIVAEREGKIIVEGGTA